MNAINKLILSAALASILSACQTESSPLVAPPAPLPPPEKFEEVKAQKEPATNSFVPTLDILFVIDDSGSMKNHQANLSSNIDKFVESFAKDSLIDYHIGVVSVFDSTRYGRVVAEGKFTPNGQLKNLKVPAAKSSLLGNNEPRFVSRREGMVDILKETLKIGVSEFIKDGPNAQGPEMEELFSPVVAALSQPELLAGANKGFRRPGAHLAVVLVSDANDSSPFVSSEWFMDFLLSNSGDRSGAKLSTYGVIIPSKQGTSSACKRDPSGSPEKIEKFLTLTRGGVLNLCSNRFGSDLARIGQEIRKKTLDKVEIFLERVPEENSLQVTYGDYLLEAGKIPGWTYDSSEKKVVIRGIDQLEHKDGFKIKVDFVGISINRAEKGLIKRSF